MSGLGNTPIVRSGIHWQRTLSSNLGLDFALFSVRIVLSQATRSVEDGEVAIGIFVDAYLGFDVVAAMPISGDLQELVLVGDAVVGAHDTLFLQTQDVV